MIPSFQVFTFFYYNPNGEENISKKYYPPMNEICIAVLILSYAKILIRLRKNAQEVASSLTQAAQRQRARQNTRFAIKFVLISLFFILMHIFYTILPKFIPPGVYLPYSMIAFCMVANCSINSIIYLSLNPEIRRLAKEMLCCHHGTSGSVTETTVQRSQARRDQQNR
uniref:G-protein coupled receptors family 1 profile domain-containing protein n=1 Tax=Plectus sambesii TaxID=2011161 RepID=A0A914XCI1_9BILA